MSASLLSQSVDPLAASESSRTASSQSIDPILLMQQIQGMISAHERILKSGNRQSRSKSGSGNFCHEGRVIRRLVSLHYSVHDMLAEADRRVHVANMGVATIRHTDQENRIYKSYMELLRWIPSIRDIPPADLRDALQQLGQGADSSRADDTRRLKVSVVNWLMKGMPRPDPPLDTEDKTGRGFYNDVTGSLLCPINYDWNDINQRQKIREFHPDYLITAQSWPKFLYADGQYDPNNPDDGLFKGELLEKAFKAVFVSPSAADALVNGSPGESSMMRRHRGERRTRAHVAQLIGMKTVEPRAIAYVACQLRFALSSVGSWAMIVDGVFDNQEFYEAIVEWFEEAKTEEDKAFVNDLLLWWNRKVFGPTFSFQIARDASTQKSVARSLKTRRLTPVGLTIV